MTPLPITSPHNPRFQRALELRDARARRAQGRFLIDGRRELSQALAAGVEVLEAFCEATPAAQAAAAPLVSGLVAGGCQLYSLPSRLFDRLAYGQRREAVVAVARAPVRLLADLHSPREQAVAVIEGVEKPGNVGAIVRSADAAGIGALIVADPACDLFHPQVIRASLGAIFHLPSVVATAEDTLAWLRAQGRRLLAARLDHACDYTTVDWQPPLAIVLGSEAQGLSARWNEADVTGVRLPMHGAGDSLNVSVAAAVLFYEALRCRAPRSQ